MRSIYTLLSLAILMTLPLHAENPVIVKPGAGTPVRKAVCNELRKYLRYSGQVDRNFGHFLFVVGDMTVLGNYCAFEGSAVDPDGNFSDELPDVDLTIFLKKSKDGWEVISDLSRTDVPSNQEMREIRRTFPGEIPTSIIPEFWRARLRG